MKQLSLTEVHSTLLACTDLKMQLMGVDEEHPVEQLWITLAEPAPDQEMRLQIFCANDVLEAISGLDQETDVSVILYFFVVFPDTLKSEYAPEIYKLLGLLNQFLPMGSLEINPQEGIYFRYGLMTEEKWIDGLLILDIVECICTLLPRLQQWIYRVLQESQFSAENMQQIKAEFRQLLQTTPRLPNPGLLPRNANLRPALSSPPVHWNAAYAISGFVAGIIGTLAVPFYGWVMGSIISVALLGPGLLLIYRLRKRHEQMTRLQREQKQLSFYWQLLQIEQIKLQFQLRTLESHHQAVSDKLVVLAQHDIDTPAELIRLHYKMKFLKSFQKTLSERNQQLSHRQQELNQSKDYLSEEQASMAREAHQQVAGYFDWPLNADNLGQLGYTELVLLENIQKTLDYLGFYTRLENVEGTKAPHLLVAPANEPQGLIQVGYTNHWFQGEQEELSSWMLYFQRPFHVVVPDELLEDVSQMILRFNRFLPIGTLVLNYGDHTVSLRYHFIRMQGDIGSFLMIEILELINYFSQRTQSKLHDFIQGQKGLEQILVETEEEFYSLRK